MIGAAKGDGMIVAKLAGIADRDRAETLRGLRLYLPRAALPPGEDEFYYADLIGLAAVLEDGAPVGKIIAVHDFGAGDMLEIAREGRPRGPAGAGAVHPRRGSGGGPRRPPRRDRPSRGVDRSAAPSAGQGTTRKTGRDVAATILTLFPEMLPGPSATRLPGKALKAGLWRFDTVDIRDFATDKHRSVDDAPFGGGPGMVLRPDVLDAAIAGAGGVGPLINLSPRGRPLDQARVRELAAGPGVRLHLQPLRGGRRARARSPRSRRSASAISCCRAASRRRSR